MAWTDLKTAVAAIIKTNGAQEITGALHQGIVNTIIDTIGEDASYKGIATPSTTPGTPDGKLFYLAKTAGTYSNFSGIVLSKYEIAYLIYDSGWAKHVIQDFRESISQTYSRSISTDLVGLMDYIFTALFSKGYTPLSPIDTLDSVYINSEGAIVSGASTRHIDIYALTNLELIRISGGISGDIVMVWAIYDDPALTILFEKGVMVPDYTSPMIVNVTGNKERYIAVCRIDGGSILTQSIDFTNNTVSQSQIGIAGGVAKQDDITTIFNDLYIRTPEEMIPSSIQDSVYINSSGVVIAGASTRHINVYSLTNIDKVRISGGISGSAAKSPLTAMIEIIMMMKR